MNQPNPGLPPVLLPVPTPAAERKSFLRRHARLIVVLGLLFGVGRINQCVRALLLQHEIASIRGAGEPFTREDFARAYPEPSPAKDFRQFCIQNRVGVEGGQWPVCGAIEGMLWRTDRGPFPLPVVMLAANEARTNAELLETVLKTDFTDFGCYQGFSRGFQSSSLAHAEGFNELSMARMFVCNVLSQEAMYRAELGDSDGAMTALLRGYQVARVPLFGAQQQVAHALAAEHVVLGSIEQVLSRSCPGDADLQRLAPLLPPTSGHLLTEAFIRGRADQYCWLTNYGAVSWPHPKDFAETVFGSIGFTLTGSDGRLELIRQWNQYVAATRLPLPDAIRMLESRTSTQYLREGRPGRMAKVRWFTRAIFDRYFRLRHHRETDLMSFVRSFACVEARRASARTAVAIERWRLAHQDGLPDSLDLLVPDLLDSIPTDPFDGKPLRYRKMDTGYVVYSVGEDGIDHGGAEVAGAGHGGSDLTFIVDRPSSVHEPWQLDRWAAYHP